MDTTKSVQAIDNFMHYMYNQWCEEEAIKVFGKIMGKHLFNHWCNAHDELKWYCYLDDGNKEKIVARANEWSNK